MRLQVLELPNRVVGELVETPFALVLDGVDLDRFEELHPQIVDAAKSIGGVGALVFSAGLGPVEL